LVFGANEKRLSKKYFKKLNTQRVFPPQLRLSTPKKKRSPQKKVTCKSVLAAQVRKGREGMSLFHYTRPVTVCADTGIHRKKGDFDNLLKQII
jgi:ribosomal protein L32